MRRAIATLLLVLLPVTGCYRWVPLDWPPRVRSDSADATPRLRIERKDGSKVVLHHVLMTPDSAVGYVEPGSRAAGDRRAIARSEIDRYSVRESADRETRLLTLGLAGAAVMAFVVVSSIVAVGRI